MLDRLITPRAASFYSRAANESRHYFYAVDTRGLLYLEETHKRNVATALKDPQFLRFFYTMLRPNTTAFYRDTHPYVSVCGKELNFVLPEDPLSCLGFSELQQQGDPNPKLGGQGSHGGGGGVECLAPPASGHSRGGPRPSPLV